MALNEHLRKNENNLTAVLEKEIWGSFKNDNIHIRYTFSSIYNVHKYSCGLWVCAPDPLINRFYYNLSIKGYEAQKQRPHKLLRTFDF